MQNGNRSMTAIFRYTIICGIAVIVVFYIWFYISDQSNLSNLSPLELKEHAANCMQSGDLACAEKYFTEYVKSQPTDTSSIAYLGVLMNQRNHHQDAVRQFEKAIDMGEGTYDLFSYYADSLSKIGRVDDAIDWSYKALSIVPNLVDVKGNLAKLLVSKKQYYEALSLLETHDSQLEENGQEAYYEGQRIAIETAINKTQSLPVEQVTLRVSKFAGHFFVPLSIGEARPAMFLVDTGATKTTMNDALLEKSQVNYKITNSNIQLKTADGRSIKGKAVTIASLRLGPYEINNVAAFTCKTCALLFGQATLSQFDIKSSKVKGVEFLMLSKRPTEKGEKKVKLH